MRGSCAFCMIISGDILAHKVYENDRVIAFLDIHPSAPGHTLIIPKTHVDRIEKLRGEDAVALFNVLHRLVGNIQAAVYAPSSTIGINNGFESGQEIPHVHIHVIPRFRGDKGGIIQGVARNTNNTNTNKNEIYKIAERIRELSITERGHREAPAFFMRHAF
jgi:histidine triad (HIT) family protein